MPSSSVGKALGNQLYQDHSKDRKVFNKRHSAVVEQDCPL